MVANERHVMVAPDGFSELPSREALWTALMAIIDPPPAAIRRRRPSAYLSSFGTEVVRIELADGRRKSLFCKYGPDYVDHKGHRRGVAYEAQVYQDVLDGLDVHAPELAGAWLNAADRRTLLAVAYLPWAVPIHSSADLGILPRTAAELGRFHQSAAVTSQQPTLNRFDGVFYRRWAKGLPALAAWIGDAPWLVDLCAGWPRLADSLASASRVVVHGELFTSNALVHRRRIYFVDWESAAVGAGELDLAALTVGRWPPDAVAAAERAYVRARFGYRPPRQFAETLAAARVYVLLDFLSIWLRESPERLQAESWVLDQLRREATALGVL